jgi:selenocysteine lyase/cysteine desulfurase
VGANDLHLHALPVDVMACAPYKWLLGPYGTGFAYVARELLDKLDLPVINWYSVEGAEDFDSLPTEKFSLIHDARVFDSGETGNFISLHGLDASLEYVEGVTIRNVNPIAAGCLISWRRDCACAVTFSRRGRRPATNRRFRVSML